MVKEEVSYIEKQIMKLKCALCKDGNLIACPWVLCRLCNNGVHKSCDVQYVKSLGSKVNKYLCPSCRKEKDNEDEKKDEKMDKNVDEKEEKEEKEEKVNNEENNEEESFVL